MCILYIQGSGGGIEVETQRVGRTVLCKEVWGGLKGFSRQRPWGGGITGGETGYGNMSGREWQEIGWQDKVLNAQDLWRWQAGGLSCLDWEWERNSTGRRKSYQKLISSSAPNSSGLNKYLLNIWMSCMLSWLERQSCFPPIPSRVLCTGYTWRINLGAWKKDHGAKKILSAIFSYFTV